MFLKYKNWNKNTLIALLIWFQGAAKLGTLGTSKHLNTYLHDNSHDHPAQIHGVAKTSATKFWVVAEEANRNQETKIYEKVQTNWVTR